MDVGVILLPGICLAIILPLVQLWAKYDRAKEAREIYTTVYLMQERWWGRKKLATLMIPRHPTPEETRLIVEEIGRVGTLAASPRA